MLAFDMGVWGPFGTRHERAYTLSAHVQSADGSWMTKEVPGAQSWEDWDVAWDFASVCWVMAGIIEKGVADTYHDYVKKPGPDIPTRLVDCMPSGLGNPL